MAGKTNALETAILEFMFQNVAMPTYGGTLYVSLHTASPGEAGNQTTNEASYTSYARVAVTRDNTGWTVSGNQASNAALTQFPKCTGSTNTITDIGIGTSASGAGTLLYFGSLSSSLDVSNNIQPQFAAGQLTITED